MLANATEQFGLGHAKLLPKYKRICCGATEITKGLLKIPRLCQALIGSSANEGLCEVPRVPDPLSLGAGGWGVPVGSTLQMRGAGVNPISLSKLHVCIVNVPSGGCGGRNAKRSMAVQRKKPKGLWERWAGDVQPVATHAFELIEHGEIFH